MVIDLPWPPSTNHYWRQGRSPRGKRTTYLSDAGKQFKTDVFWRVKEQHPGHEILAGPVRITVELYPPDNKKRDLDNFAGKALYDALMHAGVILDDDQIRESHNYWRPAEKPGRCLVSLEQL